jgi:hypothetical protein
MIAFAAAALALQTSAFACLVSIEEENGRLGTYWITGKGASIQSRRLPGAIWTIENGEFYETKLTQPESGTQKLQRGSKSITLGSARFASSPWSAWHFTWIEGNRFGLSWTAEKPLPGDSRTWSLRQTLTPTDDGWREVSLESTLTEIEMEEAVRLAENVLAKMNERERFDLLPKPSMTGWAVSQIDGLRTVEFALQSASDRPPVIAQLRLPIEDGQQKHLADLWSSAKSSGALALAADEGAGIAILPSGNSLIVRAYDGNKMGRTLRSGLLSAERVIQLRIILEDVEGLDAKAPKR